MPRARKPEAAPGSGAGSRNLEPEETSLIAPVVDDTSLPDQDDLSATEETPTTLLTARQTDLTGPAIAASAAITPLHAPAAALNSLGDWGKAIGTALHLPTPNQVVQGTKNFVITCACALINGALNLFSGLMAPAAFLRGTAPVRCRTPSCWTVLGWAAARWTSRSACSTAPARAVVNQVTTSATPVGHRGSAIRRGDAPFGPDRGVRGRMREPGEPARMNSTAPPSSPASTSRPTSS